jgi:hypothetical protein
MTVEANGMRCALHVDALAWRRRSWARPPVGRLGLSRRQIDRARHGAAPIWPSPAPSSRSRSSVNALPPLVQPDQPFWDPQNERLRHLPCQMPAPSSSAAACYPAARSPITWPSWAGRDIVLLERKQLTCGTTWHAAGPDRAIAAASAQHDAARQILRRSLRQAGGGNRRCHRHAAMRIDHRWR